MSGRKYSQVELANDLREAIRCRLAAERACERAESLVAALEEAAEIAEALRPSSEQVRQVLTRARRELATVSDGLTEDRLLTIDLAYVRERRRRIDTLLTDLDRIASCCNEGSDAAVLRAEIGRVASELGHSKENIEPWARDTYTNLFTGTAQLVQETDRQIRSAGNATAVAGRIRAQVAAFQEMLQQVEERRGLDAERRYVADALCKVCTTEMGFVVRTLPQDGPLDDLVLEVDTFAYGIIQFRLQLDGTIRSLSQMVVASCPTNFARIEQKLRQLGVITGFRYEGDQSPVNLGGDARQAREEPEAGTAKGVQR